MNETATRHANQFLADLTQAMRSTAETARQATIEQCQADAKSYTEQLQARTDGEGASLRQAAEADVSAIRDWSTAEIERIGVETEQRIARRRELLEQELHEYASAIEVEIASIQKHVADYEAEVASFFERLLKEGDPSVFASMAAQMPESPSFGEGEYGSISPHLPARSEEIIRSGAETAVRSQPRNPAAGPGFARGRGGGRSGGQIGSGRGPNTRQARFRRIPPKSSSLDSSALPASLPSSASSAVCPA